MGQNDMHVHRQLVAAVNRCIAHLQRLAMCGALHARRHAWLFGFAGPAWLPDIRATYCITVVRATALPPGFEPRIALNASPRPWRSTGAGWPEGLHRVGVRRTTPHPAPGRLRLHDAGRCVPLLRHSRVSLRRATRRALRYCTASATCATCVAAAPARSAMVRATLSARWVERRAPAQARGGGVQEFRRGVVQRRVRVDLLALQRAGWPCPGAAGRARAPPRSAPRIASVDSPGAAASSCSGGSVGTSTCRSMRSSSGPLSLPW